MKWSTSQTYFAAYLSDKWAPVKNLVLQPGVRVSNNSFMSEWLIEPRFNLSWDPLGDGKTVIRAGANLYRDRVGDYIQQMTSYPLTTTYYDFGGFGWEEAQTYRTYVVSPDITYPTTTELSIGVERDLFRGIFASANFIYRNYKDQIYTRYINLMDPVTELRDDPTKGRLAQMNNGGYAKYKGLQLVLGKHMGQDRFQFLVSFTHQVSKGNSFLFLDMSQAQGILNPQYKGDAQPADLFGNTVYDKPYAFKVYVAVRLPLNFLVSAIFDVTAGTPYTTYSYDLPTYEHPYFVSGYQALRSPQTKNLDIRLKKISASTTNSISSSNWTSSTFSIGKTFTKFSRMSMIRISACRTISARPGESKSDSEWTFKCFMRVFQAGGDFPSGLFYLPGGGRSRDSR